MRNAVGVSGVSERSRTSNSAGPQATRFTPRGVVPTRANWSKTSRCDRDVNRQGKPPEATPHQATRSIIGCEPTLVIRVSCKNRSRFIANHLEFRALSPYNLTPDGLPAAI